MLKEIAEIELQIIKLIKHLHINNEEFFWEALISLGKKAQEVKDNKENFQREINKARSNLL